jgi:tetratricopeptide (TPR) repeat protein/CHAT domain-containing protein
LDEALKELQDLLAIARRLYPTRSYPDGHADIAASLNNLGAVLGEMGRLETASSYLQEALAMRRRLYPASKYPDGHPELATSLSNLGAVLRAMGRLEPALEYQQEALAMKRRLYPESKYPDGHPDVAGSLYHLAVLLQAMDRLEPALACNQQALAMWGRLYPKAKYPDGHPVLAMSLNNLGLVLQAMGRLESALDFYEQALAMMRRLYPESKYPDGHPELARGLNNLGFVLQPMGRLEPALDYFQQSMAMMRRLYPESKYPDGHPDLVGALNNLGSVLSAMGRLEPALDYHQQSLEMRRRLYPASKYPDGHLDLASSLNNVGSDLNAMGRLEPALVYYEQSLAMRRRLYPESKYPDGHPALARGLGNLGGLLKEMGRFEPALNYQQQSLSMFRRLYPESKYPDGHPDLASALNDLGTALLAMRRPEPALSYLQQALAMRRRLYPASKYPAGHPALAMSLFNLGGVLQDLGRLEPALEHVGQALTMYSRLARELGEFATESEALAFWRDTPMLDVLLSVSHDLPDSLGRVWALVWTSRAAIVRVGEARYEALAAADLPRAVRERMKDLLVTRRLLARWLLQPPPTKPEVLVLRGVAIRTLTEERDRLERELAREVAGLSERQQLDRIGPADLEKALPPRSAYVDVLRYTRFGYDPKRHGTFWESRTPHYVAFVVRAGQPVRRVELGPAGPIEEALADWRHAIDQGLDSPASGKLRGLVWEPIARHLAADTQSVYLVPDGALSRLPWAALPGSRPGTVLLEELAIALAPHGPFLVQHLRKASKDEIADAPILMVGAVKYEDAPSTIETPKDDVLALRRGPGRDGAAASWPFLAGTERELRLLRDIAGPRALEITGTQASTTRLLRELPGARLAHLGTHGFFNEKLYGEEQRRAAEAIQNWQLSLDRMLGAGAGAMSPLSYTGLVLAGANHPEKARPDGGILTGEMILGLDLRRMDLSVLSACQTGLGAVADGQCVQNLQRAFHVAGCRNVIASLWSVPDQPTAALMSVFYEELLHDHKSPLEALRSAQLFVYRHPDQVKDLAQRGAPLPGKGAKLADPAAKPKAPSNRTEQAGDASARRSPARDWAGFVLSGPGQ